MAKMLAEQQAQADPDNPLSAEEQQAELLAKAKKEALKQTMFAADAISFKQSSLM